MDFQDANLKDVLKIFSQQTGINVIATADVGDQPVTLYLEDVTAMDALDQILQATHLTYERQAGSDIYIVKRKAQGAESNQTITRVYRLKYARVSQSVLAQVAAAFAARTPYEASGGIGSVGGGSSSGGAGGSAGGTTIGIDSLIKQLLTDQGKVEVDGRTNSLIITDVPDNFPRLEAALVALDVRTPQIMVDAEIIETSLAKAKDLGVTWGTGATGTVFQLTPAKVGTKFPFSRLLGLQAGGEGLKKGTADPTITLGTLDYAKALAVLDALESDSDTKILARPKVLTLDNESALIRLTANESVGFTTTSQATTGSQSVTPERQTTGVILSVTPQVNDGGYITMLIEPNVTKTVASSISATVRDPKTRSVRNLVRIHDGDTLVVGGLIDHSDSQTLRQVPILSSIPVIGEAFKHTEISNTSSELIVFITPHLLDEPAQTAHVASAPAAPMGMREQEPAGQRQETIEKSLNKLEQPKL